jgi:hypothetical protein
LVVIGIIFHVVLTNRRLRLNRQLEVKLAAIRAAGYPASIEELDDYYTAVPDVENAAPLYEKAFTVYHDTCDDVFKEKIKQKPRTEVSDLFGDEEVDVKRKSFRDLINIVSVMDILLGERLSNVSVAASKKYLSANRECITLLEQAVKLPKCRFNIKFVASFHMSTFTRYYDYQHQFILRTSVRLFLFKTILAIENRDSALAVKNILIMLKMCHDFDNIPLLGPYLTRIGMQHLTITTLEYTLSMIELDADSLQQLSNALEDSLDDDGKLLDRVFAGERILELNYDHLMQQPEDPVLVNGRLNRLYQFYKLTGFDIENKLKSLELNEGHLKLDKNNIEAIKCYDDEFGTKYGQLTEFYFLTQMAGHPKSNILYKRLETEARIKGALIGLAIERYRLKYKKLPEKLTQLVPEFIKKLPNDPFTGKSFRYVVGDIELPIDDEDDTEYPGKYRSSIIPSDVIKRSGWMVYSFGKDQNDDNGMPPKRGSGAKVDDISFRCVNGKSLEDTNKLEMKDSIFTKKKKKFENSNTLEKNYAIFTKKLDSWDTTSEMLEFKTDIIKHPKTMYLCAKKFLLSDIYFNGKFKENLNNIKDNFLYQKKHLALSLAVINNLQYNKLLTMYYYNNHQKTGKLLTDDEQVEIVIKKLIHPGERYIKRNKLTEKDIKISISKIKEKKRLIVNSSWNSGPLAGGAFKTILERRNIDSVNYWIAVKHEITGIY